ncbi:MAG: type II toxin-antitoxin system RelE/ParE family toxin [Acidobacteria bacterium]|nr:type II toxin-antitoxin system RelE/ParE family toxin [Acidobacteriota bacterium]
MSTQYVLKPKADLDLDAYGSYLAREANIDVALRFYDEARRTFALLAAQPNMGWKARVRHAKLAGLRLFRVSGFRHMLILYRVRSDGVDILRVVHGSRNLQAFLRRERLE